ncbi:MAG TPA: pirin family protein [Spirochaetota bacterium]
MHNRMVRGVARVFQGKETIEGAGVRLSRAFGYDEAELTDPFLLFDHFGSEDPRDYVAGFPWHPHRGIETVTYLVDGVVEHEDSLGNQGRIASGDVQWMTAGSGIIHKEMPLAYERELRGFQLWVNLPAASKMISPRYRGLDADKIPSIKRDWGSARIISGELDGVLGAAQDIIARPRYLDISLNKECSVDLHARSGETVIIYVFEGMVTVGDGGDSVSMKEAALLTDGVSCSFHAGDSPARFLFMSAAPLREPIAWRGPIVMNTEHELAVAFKEYYEGTFVK